MGSPGVQTRASCTFHFSSNITSLLFFLQTAAQKICLKCKECLNFTLRYFATSTEWETHGLVAGRAALPISVLQMPHSFIAKVTTKTVFAVPPSVTLTSVCAILALRFLRQNYKLLLIGVHHHESLPSRKQSM